MAKIRKAHVGVQIEAKVVLELDEHEAAALEAIFSYNVDAFLAVFYERMGKAYVQPHEEGVRSLHKQIRGLMAGPLAEVKAMRTKIFRALHPEGL